MQSLNWSIAFWNSFVFVYKKPREYNASKDFGFDSKADCKDAIAMQPNRSSYYYYLARPYYDLAEYVEVIQNCEKAIALDPVNYDAIIMRANVLDMYGRSEEAKKEYLKASQNFKEAAYLPIEIAANPFIEIIKFSERPENI